MSDRRQACPSPWAYLVPVTLAVCFGTLLADGVRLLTLGVVAVEAGRAVEREEEAQRLRAAAERDRRTPYYPAPSTAMPQGSLACLQGRLVRRESNGWAQVLDQQSGQARACRDRP